MDVYASVLPHGGTMKLDNHEPLLGIVAEGVIELQVKGKATQRILAGQSFSLPVADSEAAIVNASSEVPAKLITFRLL